MTKAIQLTAYTAICALGYGKEAIKKALVEERTGLMLNNFEDCNLQTYIGRIANIESQGLAALKDYGGVSRNNQVAYAALQQDNFAEAVKECIKKYGSDRVGVVLGTSTSGFNEFEHAYQHRKKNGELPDNFPFNKIVDFFASAEFIAHYFSLTGPVYTISTACSSSAKAFISASRLLNSKNCDAVIVAGVDSLCLNTLYGFSSLELLAPNLCQPCAIDRAGLNIGEAGAVILLERSSDKNRLHLLGYGESVDAYHMSAPHPEGLGARLAMQQALNTAHLKPADIDYINMHGTASIRNDKAEDHAIYDIFKNTVPCSSTKGWTGHTLGAAGALEAVISCLLLELNLLPGCLNTKTVDPSLKSRILIKNEHKNIEYVLSNSFGFGGNNCSLVIGRANAV